MLQIELISLSRGSASYSYESFRHGFCSYRSMLEMQNQNESQTKMQTNKSAAECQQYNTTNAEAIANGLLEAWLPKPAPVVRTTSKHHGGWRNGGCAILPIGIVNLTTAKNAMFGTMWDCWEESEKATNILVKEYQGKIVYRVIHTSGSGEDYLAGDTMSLRHDQTGSRIGFQWTVVGTAPHTKEGLLQLKKLSGKTSLAFSTFK